MVWEGSWNCKKKYQKILRSQKLTVEKVINKLTWCLIFLVMIYAKKSYRFIIWRRVFIHRSSTGLLVCFLVILGSTSFSIISVHRRKYFGDLIEKELFQVFIVAYFFVYKIKYVNTSCRRCVLSSAETSTAFSFQFKRTHAADLAQLEVNFLDYYLLLNACWYRQLTHPNISRWSTKKRASNLISQSQIQMSSVDDDLLPDGDELDLQPIAVWFQLSSAFIFFSSYLSSLHYLLISYFLK